MLVGRLRFDSGRFTLEEIPVPAPEPGEALVAMKAAAVCLSGGPLIDGSLSGCGRSPGRQGKGAVWEGRDVSSAF